MVTSVTNYAHTELQIKIPHFKGLRADGIRFGYDIQKNGNQLELTITNFLEWEDVYKGQKHIVATAKYVYILETDGSISTTDIYFVVSDSVVLFKNMLALSADAPEILPTNIVVPPQKDMEVNLKVLVDWFDSN